MNSDSRARPVGNLRVGQGAVERQPGFSKHFHRVGEVLHRNVFVSQVARRIDRILRIEWNRKQFTLA